MVKSKKFLTQLVGCSFLLGGINVSKAVNNTTPLELNQNIIALQDTTAFLRQMTVDLVTKINEYFDNPNEYYQKYYNGIDLSQEQIFSIYNAYQSLDQLAQSKLDQQQFITWEDIKEHLCYFTHAKSFTDHPIFGPAIYKILWSELIKNKGNLWDGLYIDEEKKIAYHLKIELNQNLSIDPESFGFKDQSCKGSCSIYKLDQLIEKTSFELTENGQISIKGKKVSIELGLPSISDFYESVLDVYYDEKHLTIYNHKYEKPVLSRDTSKWLELKPSNKLAPSSMPIKLFPENTVLNLDAESVDKGDSKVQQNFISILFKKDNTKNAKLFCTIQQVNTKSGERTLEDIVDGKAKLTLVYPNHIYVDLAYLKETHLFYLGTTTQIQELLTQNQMIPFYQAGHYETHKNPSESLITFDLAKVTLLDETENKEPVAKRRKK